MQHSSKNLATAFNIPRFVTIPLKVFEGLFPEFFILKALDEYQDIFLGYCIVFKSWGKNLNSGIN